MGWDLAASDDIAGPNQPPDTLAAVRAYLEGGFQCRGDGGSCKCAWCLLLAFQRSNSEHIDMCGCQVSRASGLMAVADPRLHTPLPPCT